MIKGAERSSAPFFIARSAEFTYHYCVMKTITYSELVEILRNHKGATPISFTALTTVNARKTGNPYDAILKLSTVNAFTGHDYENSVNRQRLREGKTPDFVEQGRAWGTNINNLLVEKDGKFYLRVRPLKSLEEPTYFTRVGNKLTEVKKSVIERFLPAIYHSQIQNTDKEIIHREYMVENLRTVSINGEHYELVQTR